MKNSLIIAGEPGYHCLPGVMAQDVTSWSEMRQVYNQLKKKEVRERFSNIAVDSVDVLSDYCTKYICQQNDIESLGELPYGQGWSKFKKEFTEVFRGLTQLGYGVYFIGHDKRIVNEETGEQIICPALSSSIKTVVAGLADIYGYAHQKTKGENSVLTLRDSSGSIECGGRHKYIAEEVPFDYEHLVNAVKEAIDKEAAIYDNQYVTDERIVPVETKEYDFKGMMNEFQDLTSKLMEKSADNGLRIVKITNKYLGKNKKVGECTPEQSEQLELIILDLRELAKEVGLI